MSTPAVVPINSSSSFNGWEIFYGVNQSYSLPQCSRFISSVAQRASVLGDFVFRTNFCSHFFSYDPTQFEYDSIDPTTQARTTYTCLSSTCDASTCKLYNSATAPALDADVCGSSWYGVTPSDYTSKDSLSPSFKTTLFAYSTYYVDPNCNTPAAWAIRVPVYGSCTQIDSNLFVYTVKTSDANSNAVLTNYGCLDSGCSSCFAGPTSAQLGINSACSHPAPNSTSQSFVGWSVGPSVLAAIPTAFANGTKPGGGSPVGPAPAPVSSPSNAGLIAGIVVGCLVVISAIIAAVVITKRRKALQKKPPAILETLELANQDGAQPPSASLPSGASDRDVDLTASILNAYGQPRTSQAVSSGAESDRPISYTSVADPPGFLQYRPQSLVQSSTEYSRNSYMASSNSDYIYPPFNSAANPGYPPFRVIESHDPQKGSPELTLNVGDVVTVFYLVNETWGQARNDTTERHGLVPMRKLAPHDASDPSAQHPTLERCPSYKSSLAQATTSRAPPAEANPEGAKASVATYHPPESAPEAQSPSTKAASTQPASPSRPTSSSKPASTSQTESE
ncbi:uncharacterized protein BJ171DRAFT_512577 [Polychytrium aggregatum]|uniref:uncharacterized protein n=1 Tax=Polychytrium aggregatum TaxID=110093 RepID=UPI0022FDBE2A|nr:uncharacterized protein BJ171DRAFT_512577 [Polychytrium aggregatum]KAI9202910.1 hypothetical protein BJ171DRAFT_512577 [Polychytrium aggregatum]